MSNGLIPDRKYTQEDFWQSRELLKRIKLIASKTRKSSYAILGWLMVEMLARIHYLTCYESEVGKASLNMLFLMSAPTGGGKSTARTTALEHFEFESIGWSSPSPIQAGSGESIPDNFFVQVKDVGEDGKTVWRDEWVNPNHCRTFHNDEILYHKGKAHQNSSTLEATYLSMYSGELLGRALAKGKGKEVPAGQYRAIAVFNAQPENDPFRSDASQASGMPSRLLNLNAVNPNARADYESVTGVDIKQISKFIIPKMRTTDDVSAPAQYRALPEMDAAHAEEDFLASEGKREPGRSHTLLTRAKVSCVLAALEGRDYLKIEDWHLAGHLIDHSNQMDELIQRTIRRTLRVEAGKLGAILGVKMDAADTSREQAALERVTKNLRKWCEEEGYNPTLLPHEGENLSRKALVEKHFSSRDREYLTEAFSRLYSEREEGGDNNGKSNS